MSVGDLSDPSAVTAALDEFDRLGRQAFLEKYDRGPARSYFVERNGRRYDSKAIVAAAHVRQFGHPPEDDKFFGGLGSTVPKLRSLGFNVVTVGEHGSGSADDLGVGEDYSWTDLGEMFGFKPSYLSAAGGMVSRPALNALLIITHPGGAKSFDYDDYWDGDDLIYTGRGLTGDQQRTAQNRNVGDNERALYVFEPSGTRQLRYLGSPTCIEDWWERGLDQDGVDRRVLRFRLRFPERPKREADADTDESEPADAARRTRAFDPESRPQPGNRSESKRDPAETAALHEKAVQGHHDLVAALDARLHYSEWTEVGEIPLAIDLWGRAPDGRRVIFEAKTLTQKSELHRMRAALAQLLEYRFFYGAPDDRLCIVVDGPISTRRARFLVAHNVAVVVRRGEEFVPGSANAREVVVTLLD